MQSIKEKTADYDLERYIRLCKITGMDKSRVEAIEKVIEEKEKYKYLYNKALDNTIKSDRELIRIKNKIKEIRDKAEVMDYYTLSDVIDDLNELLGDD